MFIEIVAGEAFKFREEFQDVGDVYFVSVDELELEIDVVKDGDFLGLRIGLHLLVQVKVLALVVLEFLLGYGKVFPGEVREGGKDVFKAHELAEGLDEIQFGVFIFQLVYAFNRWGYFQKIDNGLTELSQVLLVGLEYNYFFRVLVGEKSYGVVRGLFQIPETDDIALGLLFVEDAVGARVGLYEAVVFQVFIDIEGVEGRAVEAGEIHVYDQKDIDLPVFYSFGDVLVVVIEGLVVLRGVFSVEGPVVIPDI